MIEQCPICGSKEIEIINNISKKYHCYSCDSVFDLSPKPKTVLINTGVTNKPTARDIYKSNVGAIKEIHSILGDGEISGTGFIISKSGYVITNAHVLVFTGKKKGGKLCESLYFSANRSNEFSELQIIYADASLDLALLKTNDTNLTSVKLAKKDAIIGDKILTVGNSKGNGLTLLDGMVGDVNRNINGKTLFMFNGLVTNGCSGGPIFNENGEVFGVTVCGMNNVAGMNFGIPLSSLLSFIRTAEREKDIKIL